MPDEIHSEDRPNAASVPPDDDPKQPQAGGAAPGSDDDIPVRGTSRIESKDPSRATRSESSFPQFNPDRVPPRPPLPDGSPTTGEHRAFRDQWRLRRDEIESHVSQAKDQFETHVSLARDHFDQANERIKQRTGRDLILAILIGVAFGAALVASLLFIKWLFVPVALAAGMLGTYELSRALRTGGRRVDVVPQMLAAVGVLFAGVSGEFWISWVSLIVAMTFLVVWRMIAQMIAGDGRRYGEVLADVVVGAFVQIYVPFLTSMSILLLFRENGQWWVFASVAIAVAADTCAYAAGLSFGRHPMAPRISPKKTWEGFGGAVVGSLIVGVLVSVFLLHLEWWCGLILGAVIVLSATLGDLGESMLKRDLGIKDMSSWLPGHGGLLDRLDSILLSMVPALALSFLLAPWMVS